MPDANTLLAGAYRARELLIQFEFPEDGAARERAIAAVGGRLIDEGDNGPSTSLKRLALGDGVGLERAIEVLSKIPGVQFVEPDYEVRVEAVSNDASVTAGSTWGLYGDVGSPTNTYGSQATEAWAAGFTGSTKVAVGVVDTGINYTHPDLYLNVWLNQKEIPASLKAVLRDIDGDSLITFRDLNNSLNASSVADRNANGRIDAGDLLNDARWENGADEDANGYRDDLIGWDFVNNDNDPIDDNGHGTHVAGTIAASGGNGVGVAGVGWTTQVVALKFMDSTAYGYTSNAVKAVDYVTNASKAGTPVDFVATSNSWGGASFSQALLDAIVRGAKQQVLYVAAAGNGGTDRLSDNNDASPYYPSGYSTLAGAGFEAVISVAAIASNGSLATFSNYGLKSVDLGAPGVSIYSTTMNGGYGYMSGTSMATPHVAGALAVYAAADPTATAAEIRTDLLASATATASLVGKTVTGGRLDVSAFIARTGQNGGGGGVAILGTASGDLITTTVTVLGQPLAGLYGDTLDGGAGNDTLDGGAGADMLVGGAGNDVFMYAAGDTVVELISSGVDEIRSAVTVTLPSNVENLLLTGAAAANGTGNASANVLTGSSAANVLAGGAGADTLFGDAGADTLRGDDANDILNGGAGIDRLEGGLGDDAYYVDNAGDAVVEATAGGIDSVVSTASFTLGANVERLTLSGNAWIDGTGNASDNVISGNGGSNRLAGLAGADLISASAGNDTLSGGLGADTLEGGIGADRFVIVRGEAAGDVIRDFTLGDILQLSGYGAGSTLARVAGSSTDWLVTDGVSRTSEILKLANAYALSSGDYLFG